MAEKKKDDLLEIRLTLLHKELVTDKDGKVVKSADGEALERHVQATDFEITDQTLCKKISDLLGSALTAQHAADVPKHEKTGEPVLDAHKFEIPYKPKKKAPAA